MIFGLEGTNSMSLCDCSRNFSPQILQQRRGLRCRFFSAHQFLQDVFLVPNRALCLSQPGMFAGLRACSGLPLLRVQVED